MEDGIEVEGIGAANWDTEPLPLTSAVIDCYDDHRIAMSFAMASLRGSAPIIIRDCANVATSFPGFVELASNAGAAIGIEGGDA